MKFSLSSFSLAVAYLCVFGSGGPFAPAQDPVSPSHFRHPLDLVVAGDIVYVADLRLPGVWSVENGKATRLYQGEPKFGSPLNAIRCLALDRMVRLLAGDSATRNIYRFDDSGKATPLLKDKVGVGIPMAMAVNRSNDLFVADLERHHIFKIAAGTFKAVKFAQVAAPRGLAVDAEDRIWVVSHGQNQVLRIDVDGETEVVVEGRPFKFPHHITLDDEGAAYVADGYGRAIYRVKVGSAPAKIASGPLLKNPVSVAWTGKNLLVVDSGTNALLQVAGDGQVSVVVGKPTP